MRANFATTQGRLYLAAVVVLLMGLVAAIYVYLTAPSESAADAVAYRIVGGQSYAMPTDASARELQQLERLGGTAAVITFKFNRWLASLWTGRRLALTLVVLAAAISALCLHIGGLMGETRMTDMP